MILQYIGGALVTGAVTIAVLLLNRLFAKRDKAAAQDDEKDKRIEALEALAKSQQKSLDRAERDNCRIQMLIMMMHYQQETEQIMKLAEHYFRDLAGDWYMTGLFNKWLVDNKIGKPEWFNSEA